MCCRVELYVMFCHVKIYMPMYYTVLLCVFLRCCARTCITVHCSVFLCIAIYYFYDSALWHAILYDCELYVIPEFPVLQCATLHISPSLAPAPHTPAHRCDSMAQLSMVAMPPRPSDAILRANPNFATPSLASMCGPAG